MVHRVAWELYVGPIPDGHQIDHDDDLVGCHNKSCVNVEHLKPTVTNQRRRRDNTSGEWAIYWHKARRKWQVLIMQDRKVYSPALLELPSTYNGDPPPAQPPQEAIEARDRLRAHLGLPK